MVSRIGRLADRKACDEASHQGRLEFDPQTRLSTATSEANNTFVPAARSSGFAFS